MAQANPRHPLPEVTRQRLAALVADAGLPTAAALLATSIPTLQSAIAGAKINQPIRDRLRNHHLLAEPAKDAL
jgi:hypothetical protein